MKRKRFDEFVKFEKDTNGYHYAQFMIGSCYHFGYGTEKDGTKAFEWYTKSAEIYNVGVFYAEGRGVTKDINKAKDWYAKAAAQGHDDAQTQLDK